MDDIVIRLRKRAEIRRQIPTRKSVQNGEPDMIADLLDEAAGEIERLRCSLNQVLSKPRKGLYSDIISDGGMDPRNS